MKIPKCLKIGYKKYDVMLINDNVVLDNDVCYGCALVDEQVIKISSLYSKEQQCCTLIHESIHAIDDIWELGLSEEQVRKLGKGIFQLLEENPQLFSKNN